MTTATLDAFLNSYAGHDHGLRSAAAATIRLLAQAAIKIRQAVNHGVLGQALAGNGGSAHGDAGIQNDLYVFADGVFLDAMRQAPVALYASEGLELPIQLDRDAPLAIAVDPLDGSSNIDANISIGSIFSLLPATGVPDGNPAASFLQAGLNQLGAGFFVYGPQLALVLSLGSGTHFFVFSTRIGTFVQAHESRMIPPRTDEFAVNAANYRHWDEAVRLYVDDCLEGSQGPRGKDFSMQWIASLVADCYRILMRGGVFLYPGDQRKGCHQGQLHLVYEANPIALLIEQAGGAATDTINRVLEIEPEGLNQRIPIVFGSAKEVDRIARYHTDPSSIGERAPLFGNRGLFRA